MAADGIVRRYFFPDFKPKGKGAMISGIIWNTKKS